MVGKDKLILNQAPLMKILDLESKGAPQIIGSKAKILTK
jgi:hypothetical protein